MGSRWKTLASASGAMAAWAIVLSAPAQSISPYTMPDPAAATQNHDGDARAGTVTAPQHPSDQISEDEITAPPPPPPQNDPLQQMVRSKKGWAEMTPEEILGIAPEKKSTDDKASGPESRDSASSPLHDFLQQQRAGATSQTGSENPDEAGADDSFWEPSTLASGQQNSNTAHNLNAPGSLFAHLLENSRSSLSQEYSDSDWTTVFKTPPPPVQTDAQKADMQAFRDMLNPPDEANGGPSGSASEKTSASTVDPSVEPVSARYHPDGGTYTTVEDGVGRPQRLAPLPTATTGMNGYQTPYTAPSWAPKPPPWTLSAPQLFVEPQRHF